MSDDDALVRFRSGHRLVVAEGEHEQVKIVADDGSCVLAITMGESGPVLELRGASMTIAASERLSFAAPEIDMKTEQLRVDVAGDVVERVGGNVQRVAKGDMASRARSVAVEAHPGGIALEANDDIDVKGERIRLNSADPPMAVSWKEFAERKQQALAEQAERIHTEPGDDS